MTAPPLRVSSPWRVACAGVAIGVLVLLPASVAASARPAYQLKKAGARCRAGYVRQLRRVKKRVHGRTVSVLQVWCVSKSGGAAPTANPSYQLKKPGARCRAGYARQVRYAKRRIRRKTVRVREVWCIYKAGTAPNSPAAGTEHPGSSTRPTLVRTSTFVSITSSAAPGEGSYLNVASSIFDPKGAALVGQPVDYTVTDATSGQTVGSFAGVSGAYSFCTVLYTTANGTQTFSGQVPTPLSGCPIGVISMPATDVVLIRASFPGSGSYGPSVSEPRAF